MSETKPQSQVFMDGEGDAWFQRNRESLTVGAHGPDPVLEVLAELQLAPKRVLEVGCSDGYRLDVLRQVSGAECHGVDPSDSAVRSGTQRYPHLHLRQGAASALPYEDGFFDTLIYGFCLYLCDRSDLFTIAMHADRVLADGGNVVIYDFLPDSPYRNVYAHRAGVYSFKMDHSKLLSWNPAYRLLSRKQFQVHGSAADDPDARLAVTVLHKDLEKAWPSRG